MLRIKKIFPVVLAAATLMAAGISSSAASPGTRVLAKEDMILVAENPVNLVYTDSADIRYESDYGSALFVNMLVTKGQFVNEGDPIAEIHGTADAADVLEQELKLKRAKEDLTDIRDEKTRKLRDAQAFLDKMYDWKADKMIEVGKLDIESINITYDLKIASQEEYISELTKTLNAMYKNRDTEFITAPISGEIASTEVFHRDDELKDGTVVGTIYKADKALYSVKDTGNTFWYGMSVELDDYHGNIYEGKVVSSKSPTLNSKVTTDSAYIAITENMPEELPLRLNATYETVSYRNVILVRDSELRKDEHGSYVIEVTDKGNIRHYFTPGRTLQGNTVALDGLREGMVILAR